MRIRFRYSLSTLLLLPLLVGLWIKWYRGPHEFSEIANRTAASLVAPDPDPFTRRIIAYPRQVSFWAFRNFDGSLTRHGREISVGTMAPSDKLITEYRGGQRNGAFRYWNAEGELVCEGQFENDEPVGEWVYYHLGVPYQRVRHDIDQQVEIQRRYDLDWLAEQRTRTRGSDEVRLTAWHPNGQKRLEGWLLKDRPDREWQWWDKEGQGILAVTFHEGVPEEFVGQSKLEEFVKADFHYESQGAPLESLVRYLAGCGFSLRIECPYEDLQRVRKLGISTDGDFGGALGVYLALRKMGLTISARIQKDGTEALAITRDSEG
ncbi:MAG: hypothetical protein WD894_26995 [Pirellulales bacterium]